MTADVELLPSSVAAFVEALKGERGSLDAWLEVNNEQEVAAHVEAYAHATAAKDAEIEALRAEVQFLRSHRPIARKLAQAEARAERLAEVLRKIADYDPVGGDEWLSAVDLLQKWAKQALHPPAAQENDDA